MTRLNEHSVLLSFNAVRPGCYECTFDVGDLRRLPEPVLEAALDAGLYELREQLHVCVKQRIDMERMQK